MEKSKGYKSELNLVKFLIKANKDFIIDLNDFENADERDAFIKEVSSLDENIKAIYESNRFSAYVRVSKGLSH